MTDNTICADTLLEACAVGDLDLVRQLLQNETYSAKALEQEERVFDERLQLKRSTLNLSFMFDKAAAAGSADVVRHLLSFAATHRVSPDSLIRRDAICGAIYSSNHVPVFKEFLAAKPDVVDMDMGHVGTPLVQALINGRNAARYTGDRAALVRLLLENGADPNGLRRPHYQGPGGYLQAAVDHSSLENIQLLLDHGAQIEQSGAMHEAARRGRIDVLNLLRDHGADVNEQLWKNDPMYSSRSRTKMKKELGITSDVSDDRRPQWTHESPLHFSVLYRQVDATAWLVQHGADADVEDSKGWSARAMADKIGDAAILDALGKA